MPCSVISPRIVVADLEELGDVVADALVDLLPEIDMMWIECVVEVEHPGFDLGEAAGAGAWWCNTHRVTVERLGVPRALYPLPAKRLSYSHFLRSARMADSLELPMIRMRVRCLGLNMGWVILATFG